MPVHDRRREGPRALLKCQDGTVRGIATCRATAGSGCHARVSIGTRGDSSRISSLQPTVRLQMVLFAGVRNGTRVGREG